MAIGPVQLIVLGFNHPNFHGEVIAELERLRASDTVRVIDALAVYKDAEGELEVEHLSNLTEDEAIELGSKIGALIGLGFEGEEGMEEGAVAGAEAVAEEGGVHVFDDQAWDVLSSCWSTTGPCRCATRSPGPAGSGSATASSARSTWWKSAWSPPRKRRNCTNSRPRALRSGPLD
jgi:hypothetical protein